MTPRIRLADDQGFSVCLYISDHPPPHVHVRKAGKEAMIALGDEETNPSILKSSLKPLDDMRALALIMKNQHVLLQLWRNYA